MSEATGTRTQSGSMTGSRLPATSSRSPAGTEPSGAVHIERVSRVTLVKCSSGVYCGMVERKLAEIMEGSGVSLCSVDVTELPMGSEADIVLERALPCRVPVLVVLGALGTVFDVDLNKLDCVWSDKLAELLRDGF